MNIISYHTVNKSLRGKSILKSIDLVIPKGSIFFLMGLNGAGKTTLIKVTLKLLFKDSGDVLLCNDQLKVVSAIDGSNLYEHLSGFNNLKYFTLLVGAYSKEKVVRVLKDVGLEEDATKKVKSYSLGMKRRLLLALALVQEPDVLILDEPFNGLDPLGMELLKKKIIDLNRTKGISVILSSHLISQTESIATHYAVMHNGTILEQFSDAELNDQLRVSGKNNLSEYFLSLTGGEIK